MDTVRTLKGKVAYFRGRHQNLSLKSSDNSPIAYHKLFKMNLKWTNLVVLAVVIKMNKVFLLLLLLVFIGRSTGAATKQYESGERKHYI